MSYESYRARLRANGGSIKGASDLVSKHSLTQQILNSPSRADVYLNLDNTVKHVCIPTNVDTYETRKFLFLPDTKIYKGDYINYDSFIYLVISENRSSIDPQATARLCNYDFPLREETIKTGEIAGYHPNGKPIPKTKTIYHTKPCVMTSKIYSSAENSSIPLPDGAMTIYLPFVVDDHLPELNQKITYRQSQYKVTDLIFQNVFKFDNVEKGYVEIRLQRESNTNAT